MFPPPCLSTRWRMHLDSPRERAGASWGAGQALTWGLPPHHPAKALASAGGALVAPRSCGAIHGSSRLSRAGGGGGLVAHPSCGAMCGSSWLSRAGGGLVAPPSCGAIHGSSRLSRAGLSCPSARGQPWVCVVLSPAQGLAPSSQHRTLQGP